MCPVCEEYSKIFKYLNISYWILDIQIRIFWFSPTNLFGYSNNWSSIFGYLIIIIFIQMNPFPLFEDYSPETLRINLRNIWIIDDFNRILKYFYYSYSTKTQQTNIYLYTYTSLSWHLEYICIPLFIAKFNNQHTLLSSHSWM